MTNLIFKQMQAPGDILMLTVALRDLHLSYPGQFKVEIITCYPEIFFNNKYAIDFGDPDKLNKAIDLNYNSYLHKLRKQKLHFSDCFIYILNEKLNIDIKKTSSRPYINICSFEQVTMRDCFLIKNNINKPYILLNAGIKNDIPLKQYPPNMYQQFVDEFNVKTRYKYTIVQIGHDHHIHPVLKNVVNLVGKTNNLRDYFALVYFSNGCIGPVSLQMHVSAAFNKPCVVIAGGREEESWEKYEDHIYLNSIGKLDCCKYEGCWKKTLQECLNIDEHGFPLCMSMISIDEVIQNAINIF